MQKCPLQKTLRWRTLACFFWFQKKVKIVFEMACSAELAHVCSYPSGNCGSDKKVCQTSLLYGTIARNRFCFVSMVQPLRTLKLMLHSPTKRSGATKNKLGPAHNFWLYIATNWCKRNAGQQEFMLKSSIRAHLQSTGKIPLFLELTHILVVQRKG